MGKGVALLQLTAIKEKCGADFETTRERIYVLFI
jgi:hypothetical protein